VDPRSLRLTACRRGLQRAIRVVIGPFTCKCPSTQKIQYLHRSQQLPVSCDRRAILHLLKEDIKPRDIMTREAFENAMVTVMALGGSTNAVLHLLAMARSVSA
jgi:dihydroxyacid dehydratase/phosphogluconate dehydratase